MVNRFIAQHGTFSRALAKARGGFNPFQGLLLAEIPPLPSA
jgi:hypothetical protein